MAEIKQDEFLPGGVSPYIYAIAPKEFCLVLLSGAVIGGLVPGLAHLISNYLIEPFFCRTAGAFGFCAEGGAIAFGVALIILSVGGVLALASLRTYQPLLNVVAPLAALWGLDQYLRTVSSGHALEFYVLSALLFGLAYGIFYLLLRIKSFPISLLLIVIMVILVRLQF